MCLEPIKKPFFFCFSPKQKYNKDGARGFQNPATDPRGGCVTPMVAWDCDKLSEQSG